VIGDVQSERGTIGGSVATRIGRRLLPVLVAFGATLVLKGPNGPRGCTRGLLPRRDDDRAQARRDLV
jgi:CO/xanthine dehydrogenase FAD-binding subunit